MKYSTIFAVSLCFFCFLTAATCNDNTDPEFHDSNNIADFLTGYLQGLGWQGTQVENTITDYEFQLDNFMLGLDFQGLSKLIPEKEAMGIKSIAQTLKQFKARSKHISKPLKTLIAASLEVFGDYQHYKQLKDQFQQFNTDADIQSFLWDALDFISLPEGFFLSGKVVGTVVKQLLEHGTKGKYNKGIFGIDQMMQIDI